MYVGLKFDKLTHQVLIKLDFQQNGLTHKSDVVNARCQTPQEQSVAKPGTPLCLPTRSSLVQV